MFDPKTLTLFSLALVVFVGLIAAGRKKYLADRAARAHSRAKRNELVMAIDEFYLERWTATERDGPRSVSPEARAAEEERVAKLLATLRELLRSLLPQVTMDEIDRVGASVQDWGTILMKALASRDDHDRQTCALYVPGVTMDLFALDWSIRNTLSTELRRDLYVIWGIYLLVAARSGRLPQWTLEDVRALEEPGGHTHRAQGWLSQEIAREMKELHALVIGRQVS